MSFNDLEQGHGSSENLNALISENSTSDDQEYKLLIQRISQQIFLINGNISSIERLLNLLETSNDKNEITEKLHDVTDATRELVRNSAKDLKELSSYNAFDPKMNRQRRSEQQKLSKDYQRVISAFQSIQKISVAKQREHLDKTKTMTVMLQAQVNNNINEVDAEENNQDSLVRNQQYQAQLEITSNEIEYNELLITEREIEIQNIENGISELNDIFRDMSFIVNEQESGIQSIYGNVLNIVNNTKHAADELIIASRHQKNARRYKCFFLTILLFVGCFLALIILFA